MVTLALTPTSERSGTDSLFNIQDPADVDPRSHAVSDER
jgi:hypothetical protein